MFVISNTSGDPYYIIVVEPMYCVIYKNPLVVFYFVRNNLKPSLYYEGENIIPFNDWIPRDGTGKYMACELVESGTVVRSRGFYGMA